MLPRSRTLLALLLSTASHIALTRAAGAFTDSCANIDGVLTVDGDDGTITSPEYSTCMCYNNIESGAARAPVLADFWDEVNDENGDPQQAFDEISSWVRYVALLSAVIHSLTWLGCTDGQCARPYIMFLPRQLPLQMYRGQPLRLHLHPTRLRPWNQSRLCLRADRILHV